MRVFRFLPIPSNIGLDCYARNLSHIFQSGQRKGCADQCSTGGAFNAAFFTTPLKWILLILAADFLIRGFLKPSYSLYGAVSKTIAGMFNLKPVLVNAGPKIFAARIGFLFCCAVAVFYWMDFQTLSLALGSIFMLFAALEAIFRFCVACKLYPFICKTE